MLFLLNDVIFNLSAVALTPPMAAERFRGVSFGYVRRLGSELFAEQPRLHKITPDRAKRLAVLIAAKAPHVNAARFEAPAFGCPPDEVRSRFAQIGFDALVLLYLRQGKGQFGALEADLEIWRSAAA
jgi:hypothetical protein